MTTGGCELAAFKWKVVGTRTVVLLALVLVHGRDNARHTSERIALAPARQNLVDQSFLAGVRCQDGDLACWVSEQAHELEDRDSVLGLTFVGKDVRRDFLLAFALVVWHVDELVVVLEPCVGDLELGR